MSSGISRIDAKDIVKSRENLARSLRLMQDTIVVLESLKKSTLKTSEFCHAAHPRRLHILESESDYENEQTITLEDLY
jgi:hypothetical protein